MTPPSTSQSDNKKWKHVYADRLLVERNWRYNQYTLRRLQGHTDGVSCLQFNDCILVSGSYDHTIRIWDIESGECLRVLRGHERSVRALQFDETKLITGSMDGTLKVWNMQTGECLRTLMRHSDGVTSLNFCGDILVSGSADQTIRVWNFRTAECFSLEGHSDVVNQVVLYNTQYVISCSDDTTVRHWDITTKQCIRQYIGHAGPVLCLQPSTTWPHPILMTGALDNTIRMWSLETGEEIDRWFGHVEGVWSLHFNSLRLISGGHDRAIMVYDMEERRLTHRLQVVDEAINCVRMSETRICIGSDENDILILNFSRTS
jgi:F-box/WD-40 domain protein MET30